MTYTPPPASTRTRPILFAGVALGLVLAAVNGRAQIDPVDRNLLEVGWDQPLAGHGPQAEYAYYYFNDPDFFNPDTALRMALAPAYLDSEIGFKHLVSPDTDVGVGISGGAYGDNYYEVRQGKYYENESFYGNGGGASLNVYQLLDPGMKIPLNLVARGGFRYSSFFDTPQTDRTFELPDAQLDTYSIVGLRFAGNQPILYPDLGLELSAWAERQWHLNNDPYGFHDDRAISPATNLYWVYAGLDYSFKQSGNKFSLHITSGGSTDADRFSAWRLGGVLPLITEFPLEIPGYYYEELTAIRFTHYYASYSIPVDHEHRWDLRFEAATARLNYLPGFAQQSDWQTGAGCGIDFTPKNKDYQIVLRYGYGLNALRHGVAGAQSVGILFQYDFEARKRRKAGLPPSP
jgi:hypothetical protein